MASIRLAIVIVLMAVSRVGFAQIAVDERQLWEQRLYETELAKEQDRPIQFRLYGGFQYDSNLFRLSDQTDVRSTLGTDEKSDNIYQLGASAKLALQESRQKFFIEGGVLENWYQNFHSLDNTADSVRGEWDWQAGNQWNGTLGAGHRRNLDSFSNIQQDIRDMVSRDRVYGSASYQPISYLQVMLDSEWYDDKHDADTRESLNFSATSTALTVNWVTPAQNTLGVRARTTSAHYPNPTFGPAGRIDNDYRENEFSLVANWKASAASAVQGRLGYTQREFDQAPERNFSGPTWRFTYDWQPTEKTSLEFTVWRELYGFEDLTENYVRTTGIGFLPAWSVMPKLILRGKALYQTRDYFGDAAFITSAAGKRQDQERLFQVSAVWSPLRFTKLIFAVEAGDRNSNQAFGDYQYKMLSISAIRTF